MPQPTIPISYCSTSFCTILNWFRIKLVLHATWFSLVIWRSCYTDVRHWSWHLWRLKKFSSETRGGRFNLANATIGRWQMFTLSQLLFLCQTGKWSHYVFYPAGRPFVCPSPKLRPRYFENDLIDFDARRHKWSGPQGKGMKWSALQTGV